MKAPAFLFYVGDFLSSPDVQMMDTREIGAYCLLLFNAWQGDLHGHLPNNEDKLRRLTKLTPDEWAASRDILLGKFMVADGGHTRYNPRMVAEAEKQENYRLRQAENGKRGGRPKKPDESQTNPTLSETNPTLSESKPTANPNESISFSSSITKEKQASSAGEDASPSASHPQATHEEAPARRPEYAHDEAPCFQAVNFFALLDALGFGHVNKARYLLTIQRGADEAVNARKVPATATNARWEKFIQRWLENDERNNCLLLPAVTRPTGAHPAPNPALQVVSSTSYSPAAMAANNQTRY
ncbi:MAG: hypothetical protein NVS3B25_32490 [Hymenobacter sp.]